MDKFFLTLYITCASSFFCPRGIGQNSQPPVNYDIFNRLPFSNITHPAPTSFEPVSSIVTTSRQNQYSNGINPQTGLDNSIQEQNRRTIEQDLSHASGIGERSSQRAEIEQDLMNDEFYRKSEEEIVATESYRKAFRDISDLNPDHFSLIRAQFDIENAHLDGALSYDQFLHAVQIRAIHVKQILRREGLKSNNSLALNYGIQKLYQRPNIYYDSISRKTVKIPPFSYQFEDYLGKNDYENVLTEKLMRTGKGQCLSMPRLYLMIAEQLGAKAWLSLSPQHSYIEFLDSKQRLINFETTNGNLASNTWLAQSGYITAKALRNGTYLDTLSQKKLYSQCLADLLLGYLHKFNYDQFAEQIKKRILEIDPNNMQALIIDANIKRDIALQKFQAAGRPKPDDLEKYPDAYQAYLSMKSAMENIDDRGYQDMPPEAYKKWLQSMDQEKKKQANKALNDRFQSQIRVLKQNSTLIDKSRN